MKDNNATNNRRARNYKAFSGVLEAYEMLKYKSDISAIDNSKDNAGTGNPSQPSPIDFICDVETTILKILGDKKLLENLIRTYIFGEELISKSRKPGYEQRIGALFITRRLWPINKYFTTIRKRIRPQ